MTRSLETIQRDLAANADNLIAMLRFAVDGADRWDRKVVVDLLAERDRLQNELDAVIASERSLLGLIRPRGSSCVAYEFLTDGPHGEPGSTFKAVP